MELPIKLQEKLKGKEVTFDGQFYNCEGKKYTKEGYRVVAENVPVLFNSCEINIVE